MAISVFKPSIKRKDMDAVLTCLVGDTISIGEASINFVKKLCQYVGTYNGYALRKYKDALTVALKALNLGDEANILISPLSPAFYIDVIEELGYQVVVADVDSSYPFFTAESISAVIENGVDAVVLHETLGYVPPFELLQELNIPIIEDISMSLGANDGEQKCGSIGEYAIMHTESEAIITTGGGAVVLAKDKKHFRDLKKVAETLEPFDFMTDMNASLGETQMAEVEKFIEKRKEFAHILQKSLLKSRHNSLVQQGDAENIFYSFPVLLEGSLKDAVKYALKQNVESDMAFHNCVLAQHEGLEVNLPNAKSLMLRTVLFPLYPMLSKQNLEIIGKVLSTLP